MVKKNVEIAKLMGHIGRLASALGITPPTLPPIIHVADTLSEFGVYVLDDPNCIGAQLSSRFSPRHGALYQYAMSMSHAAAFRIMLPEAEAISVVEIRYYGQLAQIPAELSEPLLQDSLDGIPVGNTNQKVRAILARVQDYIQSNP